MISNKKVLMIIVYICIMLGICACVMNSSGYNYESAKSHYNKGEYVMTGGQDNPKYYLCTNNIS